MLFHSPLKNQRTFEQKNTPLHLFYKHLRKLSSVESRKKHFKEKKKIVYNKDSEFFNELLGTYFDEYMHFSYSKAFSSKPKYGPRILVIVIKVVGTKKIMKRKN